MFDWHFVDTQNSGVIERQISPEVESSDQLYADTVCLNKDVGITYARTKIESNHVDERPFKLIVSAPEEARIGDTLIYQVMVEKAATVDCLPVISTN